MISSKSAVEVTATELHLWILQHPKCWDMEKECFDNQKLQRAWEDKYGTLTNTECMRLATVAMAAKHTVLEIRRHCAEARLAAKDGAEDDAE